MSSTGCEFCVPEWSALFEGHFEGAPILSGVSQLFLLEQILERVLPGRRLAGLERLRFKATVAPREALCLAFTAPNARGQFRVTLKRGEDAVMEGVLRVD